jgi:quercetin dioxygenase-like cupin family protein
MIANPITKERIEFGVSGADTGGRYCEADLFVGPGGYAAAEHIHPRQEERFEIQRGVLRLKMKGRERLLRAGDRAVVPAGTRHVWANGGDEELHMVLRFTPALNTEEFFESYFGLAAAGKTNAKGVVRNPLQLAVLMQEFSDFIVLVRPPRWVQKFTGAVLGPVGRLLGYRVHADAASEPATASRGA